MEKKPYYISTAIAYTSAKPHIGNTYEIVLADAIARYKRMTGYDVYFQTGTDEHGQKIQDKAEAAGVTPQAYVDGVAGQIKDIWDLMNTTYDKFIRTTDPMHVEKVQKIFKRLYEQGDIYKGSYKGKYCTPCESFWTESQLVDGCCPDCGRPVVDAEEEAYFFKMSKYADRLMKHIEEHPEFIQPESRKNEMVNNFLKPGLQDLCVSRTSFDWGIPVTFDDKHVVYVWLDALTNYITFCGYDPDGNHDEHYKKFWPADVHLIPVTFDDKHVVYVWLDALTNYITFCGYDPDGNHDEHYKKFWPADVHLIGKDIIRFHTIYWPIFLMALGEELPKQVFGHPWLLVGDGKMSKSLGNVIYADDLVKWFGVDAVRYYVLHEIPFANDGVMTYEMLMERINSDLANVLGNLVNRTIAMTQKYFDGEIQAPTAAEPVDEELKALMERINSDLANVLGNLVNRTIAMTQKYFDGEIQAPTAAEPVDEELKAVALALPGKVEEKMAGLHVADAIDEIFTLLRRSNKYIDETMPWALAKDEEKRARLGTVLYNLLESIRFAATMLKPYLPETADKIFAQLNCENAGVESLASFGALEAGKKVGTAEVLFARIDISKKLVEITGIDPEEQKKAEKAAKEAEKAAKKA